VAVAVALAGGGVGVGGVDDGVGLAAIAVGGVSVDGASRRVIRRRGT
jgi:hypothetical protein